MPFDLLAAVVAIGYFYIAMVYWVPAHGGVDQNGYLYGARRLLETGSMRVAPNDPFAFVGRMWVTGKVEGTFYPKYPIGLPFIYAIALAVGGIKLVYLVNPIAMTLGLVATYLIVRRLTHSSFYGLMGMIVVGTSPVTTGLTNNPNSHATALCAVAWGMYFLLRWWEGPAGGWSPWLYASLAGLLTGYAVTIRYTEGLLLLPMGVVAVLACWDAWDHRAARVFPMVLADDGPPAKVPKPWSWKEKRIVQSLALFVAWAVPVGALVLVNRAYFGTWTGYDPTHESSGFTWKDLTNNWDTMLRQFYLTGLMFVFPLAVVGLLVWFRHDVRRALFVAAWAVPCVFVYTAYYWAPDGLAIGYSRFFLTTFPAMVAAGAIAMRTLDYSATSGGTMTGGKMIGGTMIGGTMTGRRLLRVATVAGVAGAVVGVALVLKLKPGWETGDADAPAFFTTLAPGRRALIAGAVGLVGGAIGATTLFVRPSALVVMAGATLSFITCVVNYENDLRGGQIVRDGGDAVVRNVPQGSTVFIKDNFAHYLQFVGDWNFYSIDLFNQNFVQRLAEQSDASDKAQPFQAERAKALYDLLKDDDNGKLAKRQNDLMDAAVNAGKRVFVVAAKGEVAQLRNRFLQKVWDAKIVETWSEPMVRQNRQAGRWLNFNRPNRQGDRVQVWQLLEITRKPPEPPKPAPAQSTKPAPAAKPVVQAKPPTPPPVLPKPRTEPAGAAPTSRATRAATVTTTQAR